MKNLFIGMTLALLAGVAQAQITISRWQDLQPYIANQTTKLNTHTDQITALQAKVAELETELGKAKVNIANTVAAYDVAMRYAVIQLCYANAQMQAAGWAATLAGLRPFPLGDIQCPPSGTRYYNLYYLNPAGPPVPPAQ